MTEMRRLIEATRLLEGANKVVVYRGVPANGFGFDTAAGVFFSESRHVAASYAGSSGKIIEVVLDLSAALEWTISTSEEFQNYIIGWQREGKMPKGTTKALARYNAVWDSNLTVAEAVGALLRERPSMVGHVELDPLMGAVKAFAYEHQCDVIIRPHEAGGSMKDGTREFIVFNAKRIKPV